MARSNVDVGDTSPIGKESCPMEGISEEYPMRTKSSGAVRMTRNVLVPSTPARADPRWSVCTRKGELVNDAGRLGEMSEGISANPERGVYEHSDCLYAQVYIVCA